ncbi:DNA-3-methyladenine glycosylase family protein [Zobellella sp. DQSA1]|uniref:DNA-3-methyladenine glycosylase family protein n=1 Tax=Zobellella sp. DQSA1 TaxID=3342386 RepID=UPI0035C1EED4
MTPSTDDTAPSVGSGMAPAGDRLALSLSLPAGFRPGDILAFHRRDPEAIAERVDEAGLHKGLLWQGRPACLSIRFQDSAAEVGLAVDGRVTADDSSALEAMVKRMLGLEQDVAAFEARYREHPQLGGLLARQRGLRVPLTASPFEALVWAVTGQQISVSAAVSIRRRLLLAAGLRHSSGLLCHPETRQLGELGEERLRRAGFSRAKTATLLALCEQVGSGQLPLEHWQRTLPVDEMTARLGAVRGIGPWTVNYTLLRGFGWLDGSLHGDVAVRRGLQRLLGEPGPLAEAEVRRWLATFSPWRALLAAHLWTMQSAIA